MKELIKQMFLLQLAVITLCFVCKSLVMVYEFQLYVVE